VSQEKNQKTCRGCKWLEVPPDKDGKQRLRQRPYRCTVEVPPPRVPTCMTPMEGGWEDHVARRLWMHIDWEHDCSFYEREGAKKQLQRPSRFYRGDQVRIKAVLPEFMSHFSKDQDAVVLGSYYDFNGGSRREHHKRQYQLWLPAEQNTGAWYDLDNLLPTDRPRLSEEQLEQLMQLTEEEKG